MFKNYGFCFTKNAECGKNDHRRTFGKDITGKNNFFLGGYYFKRFDIFLKCPNLT